MNHEIVKPPITTARYKRKIPISITFLIFFGVPFILGILMKYQTIAIWLSATILLFLTWRLYRHEGSTLSELGLDIRRHNLRFLASGIIVGCVFFTLLFIIQKTSNSIQVEINKHASYYTIAAGLFLLLPAVLLEELIFRGYCFQKSVEKLGIAKANVLFAFLFLVWHWIALNAWGNIGMMIGLLTTSLGHLLFSTALIRSGTLYFPIGIHLGNNWTSHYLFASSTRGLNTESTPESLFIVTTTSHELSQVHNALNYAATFSYMLIFTWIIWKWKIAAKPEKAM